MSADRITRVNELIKREIGTALFRIMTEQDFDLAAVTVTRVVTSPTLRDTQVFVSIRGEGNERSRMLGMLRRHRGQIQKLIAANIKLKYTPRVEFRLDLSIEKGDRILHVLSDLDSGEPDAASAGEPDLG
jgi:ribosome-binding factor A